MKDELPSKELSVKSLRESKGYSQQDLAVKVGCHWRTVADWELKGAMPRLDKAVLLAKELGVSLKTLSKAFQLDVSKIPNDDIN